MPDTDNDEKRVLRMSEDVRRQLLEQNDGFTTKTRYDDKKNFREDRTYTIRDSELHITSSSNGAWADSRRTFEWIADNAETHRYLRNNLESLNQDDVVVRRVPRPRAKPVVDTRGEEAQARDDDLDEADDTNDDGLNPAVVIAITVLIATVAVVGVVVWKKTAKPALERRRAIRAAQRAADEGRPLQEAEPSETVLGDEG